LAAIDESGMHVRVKPVRAVEVCIDVNDPVLESMFWCDFLGYRVIGANDVRWVHLEHPGGLPVINLQRVPEAKRGKNRLHFDVFVDDPEQWIDLAVSLGAVKVQLNDAQDDWFCVMHDPEGNEFCICLENEPA
jgi:hypothetical protein